MTGRSMLARPIVTCIVLAAASCGKGSDTFEPFKAPLFDCYDLNPDSLTHGEARSLSEREGKVTALYFTSYGCSYCISHYPALYKVFDELRGTGGYPTEIGLWLLGYPVAGSKVEAFCKGTDVPCFVDKGYGEGSVYASYRARLGHMFIIDKSLWARYRLDLVSCPMENAECSAKLKGYVTRLLDAGL